MSLLLSFCWQRCVAGCCSHAVNDGGHAACAVMADVYTALRKLAMLPETEVHAVHLAHQGTNCTQSV